jgi:hypothetical protein
MPDVFDRPEFRLFRSAAAGGALVLLFAGLAAGAATLSGCAPRSTTSGTSPAPATTSGTMSGQTADDPEVSRSRGSAETVVVLWPRIIPAGQAGVSRELAGAIQNHLRNLVSQALPGRAIDVRPEPERVCPQAGCLGPSVGVLFLRDENGCAVLALVSAPGQSSTQMVPWVGLVDARPENVPFRQPPESYVTVKDFSAPCSSVLGLLVDKDAEIIAAIRSVAG